MEKIITLSDCIKATGENKYSLVLLVAQRTRMLANGASPLVPKGSDDRLISTAIKEIYEKKITRTNVHANENEEFMDDSLAPNEMIIKTVSANTDNIVYRDINEYVDEPEEGDDDSEVLDV